MKIHFIGIGGIGVSALAKYYLAKGHTIYGSDLVSSELTKELERNGATLYIGGHKPENISENIDLVIYSPAIGAENPELNEAKMLKLKCQSYPEALGDLTKKYFTVAVSGTHGKSTTTAMLSLLMIDAGLDPTVVVGTKLKEFKNSNCRVGKSEYLVIEADEHFSSFLNYWPKIIVLTNIEADHLDHYKNLNNILRTFKEYVSHLPKDGILIANKDDKNTPLLLQDCRIPVSSYSLRQKEAQKLKKILKVPGNHNIVNALAALTVARALKIPDQTSFKALSRFRGTWRRFEEKKLQIQGLKFTVISDYGHHPTEVLATLKAAREKYPKKKIWCFFQPHQYQRTYYLFDDFVESLKSSPVDKLIITDIYDVAGREEKTIKKKVDAKRLAEAVRRENVFYLPKDKIASYIKNNISGGEVIVIMGAGDIYKLTLK